MREQGKSFREIAQRLGRRHQTISRELKRNRT
ncbi:MAG: helix-turn-helix domain-containing protein, partial [bacterium]|nr:helix-turn-helix domain-containing protein [bacterium]